MKRVRFAVSEEREEEVTYEPIQYMNGNYDYNRPTFNDYETDELATNSLETVITTFPVYPPILPPKKKEVSHTETTFDANPLHTTDPLLYITTATTIIITQT